MTFKIGNSQSSDINFSNSQEKSEIENLQSNTAAENEAAIAFLVNDNAAAKVDGVSKSSNEKVTVSSFLRKIRSEQPFDEATLAKKQVKLAVDVRKPANQTTVADYDKATWRTIFKQAGYGMLTDQEIALAVGGMRDIGWKVNDRGFTLSNLRTEDAKPGALVMTTTQGLIEKAKRAGQAVLQYQVYQAKESDLQEQFAQSKTNQMLLDPLRLGGNTPVRWVERTLNTPRDILQQIDRGEIMPGTSTVKWAGSKVAEQITGQPAPQMPTASESIEQLTGIELPTIPEVKVDRPFEYQTEKYKREGNIGEDLGATAIDLLLLKRGIVGKPNAIPESLGNLNISKVFRVQGGTPPRASKFRIFIGESGEMVVKDKTNLFVTFDDMNRVRVFNGVNRAGKAEIISFEVKTSFVQQVRKFAVQERKAQQFPDLPQISDPTKTNSSFGLPPTWIEMLKDSTIRGTGRIEQLQPSTPFYKLFPAVTTTNQLKEQPK